MEYIMSVEFMIIPHTFHDLKHNRIHYVLFDSTFTCKKLEKNT